MISYDNFHSISSSVVELKRCSCLMFIEKKHCGPVLMMMRLTTWKLIMMQLTIRKLTMRSLL